jgi:NADH-quinone oxidoreductase E subunit
MAHLTPEVVAQAREVVALYPQRRSALIPVCHLAQAQEGWLTPEAIEDISELLGVTAAEVEGTASFYDMLHTEPVGRYVVSVCTNIACMLAGAYELLEHAEERLGTRAGGTTADGLFTLEEVECLAACDVAPCLQVNSRFFGPLTNEGFNWLMDDLAAGKLADDVPQHGVLCRYERRHGLEAAGGAPAAGARRAGSTSAAGAAGREAPSRKAAAADKAPAKAGARAKAAPAKEPAATSVTKAAKSVAKKAASAISPKKGSGR